MESIRGLAICSIALTTLIDAGTASAQVPNGWMVVSCFKDPFFPGDGGLFLVDPANGAATALSGLGNDLTGVGSSVPMGANSVLVRFDDGALIAGEIGPAGTAIDLHLIQITGTIVTSDQTFFLGIESSPYGGGITQAAMLFDGRVLVGVFGIGSGPLAGASLGIVDLANGSVTAVPVTLPPVTPALNALCLDPGGATAWFSMDKGNGTSTLYTVPVPGGGTATIGPTLCANVSNLAFDCARNRIVASGLSGACAGRILEVDPTSGQVTSCVTGLTWANAITIETASGDRLLSSDAGASSVWILRSSPPGCSQSVHCYGVAGGWGQPSGIAIAQIPISPSIHCTAKTNSLGCTPAVGFSGFPSASSGSGFAVTCTLLRNNKSGLLFYGNAGRNAFAFQCGTLCVKSPIKRTPAQSSGGTPAPSSDCSGTYSIDMNAFAAGALGGSPAAFLGIAGTVVECQWWGRDPGFPAPCNTQLSDALEYTISL